MASRNEGVGIFVASGLVSHSTASFNFLSGTFLTRGIASYNIARGNGDNGLSMSSEGNYFGNNFDENAGGPVFGGKNHGQNLCDGVTCPGAEF